MDIGLADLWWYQFTPKINGKMKPKNQKFSDITNADKEAQRVLNNAGQKVVGFGLLKNNDPRLERIPQSQTQCYRPPNVKQCRDSCSNAKKCVFDPTEEIAQGMTDRPSTAAMRAAERIYSHLDALAKTAQPDGCIREIGQIIDQETGLKELIEAVGHHIEGMGCGHVVPCRECGDGILCHFCRLQKALNRAKGK